MALNFVIKDILTQEFLDDYLRELNESGVQPVVVGIDSNDVYFLAYGFAPGGDGWDTGVVLDDPRSHEFDYGPGMMPCEECHAHPYLDMSHITFPVTLFRRMYTHD